MSEYEDFRKLYDDLSEQRATRVYDIYESELRAGRIREAEKKYEEFKRNKTLKCKICPGKYKTWKMEPDGKIINVGSIHTVHPEWAILMTDKLSVDKNITYGATMQFQGKEWNVYVKSFDILEIEEEIPEGNSFEL